LCNVFRTPFSSKVGYYEVRRAGVKENLRMHESSSTESGSARAAARPVWVFFYGSFINLEVLRRVDLVPERVEVARLGGFDIRIEPLANLVRSGQHSVYGTLVTARHAELDRLYAHARDDLGGTYLPEAVLAESLGPPPLPPDSSGQVPGGVGRPALCYIAPEMEPAPATNDYIDRIVGPARAFGFPPWYIARLESFRP
jgi:hypothetical protein